MGAGRRLLVSLYYKYSLGRLLKLVILFQKSCRPGLFRQREIFKLIPEVSCISIIARLLDVFREDPSWKRSSLSTLFKSSNNPVLLVGLPDFYPTLHGPYFQDVCMNAG